MTEQQTIQNPNSMTTESQGTKSFFDSTNIFNSHDFGKFLNKEFPSSSPSLSLDLSLGTLDDSSSFKSKDVFSHLFSSDEWGMKLKPDLPSRENVNLAEANLCTKEPLQTVLTSKDWIPSYLGTHLDNCFDKGTLLSGESSAGGLAPHDPLAALPLPPNKTQWDKMYMSQLQLMFPKPSTDEELSPPDDFHPWTRDHLEVSAPVDASILPYPYPVSEVPPSPVALAPGLSSKKKRKRRPRPKVVPSTKVYVEPTLNDVLLGRGGRSNHHPGNKRYRDEVKNLREWYGRIGDNKDEKTKLSQTLVDCIHSHNGRFLEWDKEGWYIVPNVVARRKASQALREDDDPEKRAAKRERFLTKRAVLEAAMSLGLTA